MKAAALSLLLALHVVGCVYYNTFYNARARYDEALESKARRAERRIEDEERYIRQLQDWLAAGGSGDDVLARIEAGVEDSLGRADSLKAVLIDSLGIATPLSPPDSLALAEAFAKLDSTLREMEEEDDDEEEEAETAQANPRPRRPRTSENRELIPSEERLLDACITKCAKVISLYPESKWIDDAVFLMGKALYEKRYYPDAHTKFVELRLYYRDSPFLEEALLYEGRGLHAMARGVDAREIWQRLVDEAVDPRVRRAAGVELAESIGTDGDHGSAIRVYRRLLDQPNTEGRSDLWIRLGGSLAAAGEFDSAVAAFDRTLKEGGGVGERFRAIFEGARALDAAGRPEQAARRLRKVASDQRHFRDAARALLELARIETAQGETDVALETYREILHAYPGTDEGAEALLALARLHRGVLNDPLRAKRALALLLEENPDSEAGKTAREELRDLDRYLSLKRDAARARGASAQRARFLLAEHLLVVEDRPEDSYLGYADLISQYPSTPWRPRADMAMAWILKGPLSRPDSADSIYREVAERYSGTHAAAVSSAAIGLPVPPVTIVDQEPLEEDATKEPPAATEAESSEAKFTPLLPNDEDDALRARRRQRTEPEPK